LKLPYQKACVLEDGECSIREVCLRDLAMKKRRFVVRAALLIEAS